LKNFTIALALSLLPLRTNCSKAETSYEIKVPQQQIDHSHAALTSTFEKPIDALGLWLMADGDNTESTFTVTITGIELTAP